MNYTGSITLSDSSRHATNTGTAGYFFNMAPPDYNFISSIIYDSTTIAGDKSFFTQQILGWGDLPLILQEWNYYGGYQVDATTYAGGQWGNRWFDPEYLKYSIWYMNYDTSQFSLIGYKFRDPGRINVGDYYAPMVTPPTPGHYQIRWLYFKDDDLYGQEIINSFTAVTRGIDAMPDYSNYTDFNGSNLPPYTANTTIITIPQYVLKNSGDNVVFGLQINGPIPAPISYNWLMNGNYIHDSSVITGTNTDTLTIYDTTLGASFSCVVSNLLRSTQGWLAISGPDRQYYDETGN